MPRTTCSIPALKMKNYGLELFYVIVKINIPADATLKSVSNFRSIDSPLSRPYHFKFGNLSCQKLELVEDLTPGQQLPYPATIGEDDGG